MLDAEVRGRWTGDVGAEIDEGVCRCPARMLAGDALYAERLTGGGTDICRLLCLLLEASFWLFVGGVVMRKRIKWDGRRGARKKQSQLRNLHFHSQSTWLLGVCTPK